MGKSFEGLNVVVTGGTGALGSAVVGTLVDRGATCHVPCFDKSELEAFELKAHERVEVAEDLDLRNEDDVEGFFNRLPSLWASIHIAGGFAMSPIADTKLADYRKMMDMNATTCFLSCREAVRKIRRANGRKDGVAGGRIVNVSARPALVPAAGLVPYAASKAAVASITQSLGEELAEDGIWVNAVVPSIMDTPANRSGMPTADHDAWPKVDEVAETIAFLASPENATTRGGLIPVYGKV